MEENRIKLEMTLPEINALLSVLGQAPFVSSYQLVSLIQDQAAPQVLEMAANEESQGEADAN